MMTKTDIINETLEYYTHNPRAVTASGSCIYLTEDGRMCAIGRCLDKNKIHEERRLNNCNSLYAEGNSFLFGLKDEYLGHDMTFWEDIQEFHDQNEIWSKNKPGLTPYGKEFYNELLTKYGTK